MIDSSVVFTFRKAKMTARIYKSYKMPTQSGGGNSKNWILEFVARDRRFQDQIMGWTGSTDMEATQVKLFFDSQNDAVKFAKKTGLDYLVVVPKEDLYVVKTYTDNYK
jgi:hypothetical protein